MYSGILDVLDEAGEEGECCRGELDIFLRLESVLFFERLDVDVDERVCGRCE